MQGLPELHGLVPLYDGRCGVCALQLARSERAAANVSNGFFIYGDQAGTGARFNRHVAYRHAALHAERAYCRTCKLDRVAGAARSTNFPNDRQHNVFGGHAACRCPLNSDQHVLRLLGQEGLGRHHMLDFAGANAMGQCTKRAMGRSVRVAANDGHAG